VLIYDKDLNSQDSDKNVGKTATNESDVSEPEDFEDLDNVDWEEERKKDLDDEIRNHVQKIIEKQKETKPKDYI
jgi:hypothetical protein